MKTEALVREYVRTHKGEEDEGKRAKIHKPSKPTRPVSYKD